MEIVGSTLAFLADEQARTGPVTLAARRDELLLRLGRLYRSRFGGSNDPVAAGGRGDTELFLAEIQLGLQWKGEVPSDMAGDIPPGIARPLHGMLAAADPSPHPEALLVLGPRGNGKDVFVQAARRVFHRGEGCVAVDWQDWLPLHPSFESPDVAQPELAADAKRWADWLLDRAIAGNRHLLVDGLADLTQFVNILQRLGTRNYRVIVALVGPITKGRPPRPEDRDAASTAETCLRRAREDRSVAAWFVIDGEMYRVVDSSVGSSRTVEKSFAASAGPPDEETPEVSAFRRQLARIKAMLASEHS
jgi:hypothetical protein